MKKTILITGTILGMTAVILGAFAAHGLENLISKEAIATFETGVKYQMYHALLLLVIGGFDFFSEKAKKTAYFLFLFGVILFSGSIYGLATNSLSSFDFTSIALSTPLGGLLLIIGWFVLLINLIKLNKKRKLN